MHAISPLMTVFARKIAGGALSIVAVTFAVMAGNGYTSRHDPADRLLFPNELPPLPPAPTDGSVPTLLADRADPYGRLWSEGVRMRLLVRADGTADVQSVQVLAAPDDAAARRALAQLRRMRFRPAVRASRPVAAWTVMDVRVPRPDH